MGYVDKYPVGAVSNSMLDALEACPLKWYTLYEQRAKIKDKYDKVLDSMQLGILVHSIIEEYPTSPIPVPSDIALNAFDGDTINTELDEFIHNYLGAIEETYLDGKRQGKTYKATPGSEYWSKIGFWAKNHSHLDAEKEQLNLRMKLENNWLCDIEPIDFVLRAITCLENYNKLLPEINITTSPTVEESFNVSLHNTTVVGTFDRYEIHNGVLYITDYKTGNKQYTPEIVLNLNQMNLYHKALQIKLDNTVVPPWHTVIYRIVSLERCEIVTAKSTQKSYSKYFERLRRQLEYVKIMRRTSPQNLTVMAGKSMAMGCPCVLSRIEGEFKCDLV